MRRDVAERDRASPPARADTQKPRNPAVLAPRVWQPRGFKISCQRADFEAMFRDRLQPYSFGFEFQLTSVLDVWLEGLDVARYKEREIP